jgi:hypothetical protein
MFNNLSYAFDAETGEIIDNKNKLTTQINVKKRRKHKPRVDTLQREMNSLTDKLDLNFISQMLLNCQLEVLSCVLQLRQYRDKNIPLPLLTDLGRLEGIYLSSLIIYRYYLDSERVNRTQLERQLSFLETLQKEKWLMLIPEFKNWYDKIKGYLDTYFS